MDEYKRTGPSFVRILRQLLGELVAQKEGSAGFGGKDHR